MERKKTRKRTTKKVAAVEPVQEPPEDRAVKHRRTLKPLSVSVRKESFQKEKRNRRRRTTVIRNMRQLNTQRRPPSPGRSRLWEVVAAVTEKRRRRRVPAPTRVRLRRNLIPSLRRIK